MSVINRITAVCDAKKIKPAHLVKIGVGAKQTVYDVLKGKQKPGIDFVSKFLTSFPDVDGDWLMLGRGEMYKESKPYKVDRSNRQIIKEPKSDYTNVKALLEEKDKRIENLEQQVAMLNDFIEHLKNEKK